MSETKFYKLTLELNAKQNINQVSFLNKFRDIVDAKNKFNADSEGSKFMLLLNLTPYAVNLILRLDNYPTARNVGIRTINRFVAILQNDLNWKTYFDAKARGVFKVSSIQLLGIKECRTVVNTLYSESNEYYDSSDIQQLFMNVDDESIKEPGFNNEAGTYPEEFAVDSLEAALQQVNTLTGLQSFKQEVLQAVKFSELYKQTVPRKETPTFPYHYLFKGEHGVNQLKPAKLMAEVLFHLGVVKSRKLAVINVFEASNEYAGLSFDGYIDETESGVVLVENIFDYEDENVDDTKVLNKLTEKMQQLKGKFIFILSFYTKDDKGFTYNKLVSSLYKKVNYRLVEFNYYTDKELCGLIKEAAKAQGCKITEEAVKIVKDEVHALRNTKNFNTTSCVDRMVENALINKAFTMFTQDTAEFQGQLILEAADLASEALPSSPADGDINPFDVLNDMVGLKDVKDRVAQVHHFLTARLRKKELGIESKPICLHMQFTGNPGTGKTTVARLLGRILKNLGFLSSGHFVELTRNDLIGEYIGQTTPKVKKALKKSKGGIMFIDEAYSLYQGSENDFGYEAVAELVKGMEDLKDDLVVIFAGYPKEMEKMVKMNPGLRDRIAFTIEFPDFSLEELGSILQKMCRDNQYTLTKEALEKFNEIIKSLYSGKGENFGNARIVRRLFERVEIYQNSRVCSNGIFDKEEITAIQAEDAQKLYEDNEIKKLLGLGSQKSVIGFRQ